MPELSLYLQIKLGMIKVHRRGTASPAVLRFWANVDKDGLVHPKVGKCWLWLGGVYPNGYGYFRIGGKSVYAHRYSYSLHNGRIENNLHVCHTCDTKICVNPSHLFLGSNDDNRADSVAKGRQARGESHGHAKLTEDDVRAIRRLFRKGSSAALAKKFGVSFQTIYLVVSGGTWRHVRNDAGI